MQHQEHQPSLLLPLRQEYPSSPLQVELRFLSSFLSETPISFSPSAAVGKIGLTVVVLRGTLFFFSFRKQLLSSATYIWDTHVLK